MDKIIKKIKDYIIIDKNIKFAYLFGSSVSKNITHISDIDIAIYLGRNVNLFSYRLKLMESLMKITGIDNIDLVVLNNAPPLLKYEVIKKNYILKDSANNRVLFETLVLQEYFDTAYVRNVQLEYMKEQIRSGSYFG